MEPPTHRDVQALAFLLGTWNGTGQGRYPTILPFEYREIITFTHTGKPFIAYSQQSFAADDGRKLHSETGYLRLPRSGWVEMVVAQPTGVVEVDEGPFDGPSLQLRSHLVGGTATAKEITAIERVFEFEPGVIRYRLRMAAVGEPLTDHLDATLQRQP